MSFKCKLCGSHDHHVISTRDAKSNLSLPISLCSQCGLAQQTSIPSNEELSIYYSHDYRQDYKKTYAPKLKHVKRAGEAALDRLAFLKKSAPITSSMKLLDIGAGGGEFVYLSQKSGFISSGIEPNHGYSEFAKREYDADVETMSLAATESATFDVITMFHVLEHMASPDAVMKKIHQILNPGGIFFIEVPNLLQKDASPHNIFFKAHLYYYCRFTLQAATSKYFDILTIEDSGNLNILCKRKSLPLNDYVLPSKADVKFIQTRVEDKGWIEYLFAGGGVLKPLKKIRRIVEEKSIPIMSPKDLLDSLIRR